MEEDVEVGWQDSSGSFPGLAAQNTQLEGMTYAQAGSHWEGRGAHVHTQEQGQKVLRLVNE